MAYVILTQRVPPDDYRDEIGTLYNYPRRYWRRLYTGDRMIYHQPRDRSNGGMVYFGCGVVGDIQPDPHDPNRRNAEIVDYTAFERHVPVTRRGRFLEPAINRQVDMVGNAVRTIDEPTALAILSASHTQPPWAWLPTGGTGAPPSSPTNEADLRRAIDTFDQHYASLAPERRARTLSTLHRPSSIGAYLKQLYGTRCRICGVDGFLQRIGTSYAEIHHVDELSTEHPGVLGTQNILILCPTCHRKLHFANVTVIPTSLGWDMTINGRHVAVQRMHSPA